MRVIFTCGGTAGHINPALALAKGIQERRPGTQVLFVGAAGESMESQLVPQAGFELRQVNINSFRRRLNAEGFRHNLKAAKNIFRSRRQAAAILDEFQPDLVVGTGGFASYPVTREAARRGIPTAIHESNAVPGMTTKRLARHVDRVMVGIAGDVKAHYPHPEKVVVTGTPVRPGFYTKTRREARAQLGLTDDKPLVLSCWGSLGAVEMNRRMVDFLVLCTENGCPFHHIHGTGKWYYDDTVCGLKKKGVELSQYPALDVRAYIDDMALCMAAADVVLCRAGASTISELIALAKPAVLVPSPNVTGDHQTKNARVLADAGGAILLPEPECSPQRLYEEVTRLLNAPAERKAMGEAVTKLAPPDATALILDTLLALVR